MNKGNMYDEISEGYYDLVFSRKKGIQYNWHYLKFKKIYSLINNLKPNNILDVACGPGTFLGNSNLESDLTGIDIAKKQINYANNKYKNRNISFKCCKNAEFPFDDETFELITAIEFIEHINHDDLVKNILEMKRCLKPGGIIILTTPNYRSLWPFLEILVSKLSSQNYVEQHISHYNKKKLKMALRDFNFKSIDIISYQLFAPFFAIFGNEFATMINNIENKVKYFPGNLLLAKIKK